MTAIALVKAFRTSLAAYSSVNRIKPRTIAAEKTKALIDILSPEKINGCKTGIELTEVGAYCPKEHLLPRHRDKHRS